MTEQTLLNPIRSQFSFLSDKAAIEMWNVLAVSNDHNKDLADSNTFTGRLCGLAFGHRQQQQQAINDNLRSGVSLLIEYCQQHDQQIAKTARGVSKVAKAIHDARQKIARHDDLLAQFGSQLSDIENRLEYIDQRIEARDRLQQILDIWKLDQTPLPIISQLLLVINELKWSQFGVVAQSDSSLLELGKVRLMTVACEKFGLSPKQLMALPVAMADLREAETVIQDATLLTVDEVNHPLMEELQRVLNGNLVECSVPVISLQRLTHEFYDSSLREAA
ncbi:hypothetical protein [Endozoicomonas sp. 4G]|uniref:hypothetical protein n=1 Tax=Endozoicomonas sp. 4G TaxID=2872754 RepID=UPI0020785F26|nr:hypothetical protein [Endozoicomonas sp. 4G]